MMTVQTNKLLFKEPTLRSVTITGPVNSSSISPSVLLSGMRPHIDRGRCFAANAPISIVASSPGEERNDCPIRAQCPGRARVVIPRLAYPHFSKLASLVSPRLRGAGDPPLKSLPGHPVRAGCSLFQVLFYRLVRPGPLRASYVATIPSAANRRGQVKPTFKEG
jgi:hypothetical protein